MLSQDMVNHMVSKEVGWTTYRFIGSKSAGASRKGCIPRQYLLPSIARCHRLPYSIAFFCEFGVISNCFLLLGDIFEGVAIIINCFEPSNAHSDSGWVDTCHSKVGVSTQVP